MKRNNLFKLFVLGCGLGTLALISSCKGDKGDTGADGTPGVDGDEVCMECHNISTKAEVTEQYAMSAHGLGEAVGYAGSRNDCAMCHSDQGFVETQYTGQDTTHTGFALPQPVQCHTCHDFHQSLDFENEPNYALRTLEPVDLLMYRAADPDADPVTINLGQGGNLCANCHQPRRVGPNMADDSTRVTSTHYGPHHGPQSTTLAGLGAYEVGTGYPTPGEGGMHVTNSTCVDCHMHDGNHETEPKVDGCNTVDCHNGSITTVDENARQVAFATKMATLESKLIALGLIVDGHPNPGTYLTDYVGALYNYEWLLDDRSNGVHNFGYMETLLDNSIAVLP